jgi:hypothetical protein
VSQLEHHVLGENTPPPAAPALENLVQHRNRQQHNNYVRRQPCQQRVLVPEADADHIGQNPSDQAGDRQGG